MEKLAKLKEIVLTKKFMLLWAAIAAIVVEIFVFNWNFWLTTGNKPVSDLNISYGPGITVNDDGTLHFNPNLGEMYIEITDVNVPVNFLQFGGEWLDEEFAGKPVYYKLYAKDAGNAEYLGLPERYTSKWNRSSQYVHLFLSGDVPAIKIYFLYTNDAMQQWKEVNMLCPQIVVNPKRPMMFSVKRLIGLFLSFAVLLACVPCFGFWEYKVQKGNKLQLLVVMAVVVAEMIFSNMLIHGVGYSTYNEPYNKLAKAISEGHFYIEDIPDERLVNLSNPYDTGLRQAQEIPFKWDFAYRNGHYYVYYGVVPAVMVFLPYRLLTGHDYRGFADNIIPSMMVIIGIALLVRLASYKFYKKMPFILSVLFQIGITFGSYTFITSAHPDFYSLPRIYSLMFIVWGLFFWCASMGENRINILLLALGSFCIALISGCRPQLLVAMFLALPLFGSYMLQVKSKDKELCVRRVKELLAFAIPFVLVAGLMMFYNYARFGSVFDFGANYNLTTNDMTKRGLSLARIPSGFFIYFMQMPVWKMQFPFLEYAAFPDTLYQGINIIELTAGGFFVCNILSLASFGSFGKVMQGKKKAFAVLCAVFVVVIAAVDTMMSGILPYYYIDFAVFGMIAACMVIAQLAEEGRLNNNYLKMLIVILTIQIVMYHLFFVIGLSNLSNGSPVLYYKLAGLFQPFNY